MQRFLIAALTASVLATAPAFADNDRGAYIGVGVGQFNIKSDLDLGETPGESVERFDSDDTSLKLFGGWRFNRYLALELAYIDLGSLEDRIAGLPVDLSIEGFAPYVVGTLPLGIFELFAKVGYFFYDAEAGVGGSNSGLPRVSDSDSDEDLVYAFGVGITLFDHLNARLEYELFDTDDDDSDAIWLSGAWRF